MTASSVDVDVLIVDDDPEFRSVCAEILTMVGYSVETASGGNEALAVVRRKRPRLIVSDLVMTPMDGRELLARLRADASLSDVPVVLLSGRRDLPAISVELAVAGHLTKPLDIDQLISTTERCISHDASA